MKPKPRRSNHNQLWMVFTHVHIGLQVIEKAYKKLRLDALVIQQGRLTETTKGVNKDDLLSMVRYGAEMVFNNTVRSPPLSSVLLLCPVHCSKRGYC